jgi:hypothetical protein
MNKEGLGMRPVWHFIEIKAKVPSGEELADNVKKG